MATLYGPTMYGCTATAAAPEPVELHTFAGPLRAIKLLEFNRPPYHPWLTVALAEEEIAIQAANESTVFIHEEGI